MPLLLLAACGGREEARTDAPIPPRPPSQPEVAPPPAAPAGAGLLPLPSPQQVVASVPVGRRDPFGRITPPVVSLPWAPPGSDSYAAAAKVAVAGGSAEQQQQAAYEVASKAGASPGAAAAAGAGGRSAPAGAAPPSFPQLFRVTGVIRSGGLSEATVTYGGASGNVRPGDRGGAASPWLPRGWTVASIDVDRGQLVLSRGSQRYRAQV